MASIEFTPAEQSQVILALGERVQELIEEGLIEGARITYLAYRKVGGSFTWAEIKGFANQAIR